MVIEAKGRRMSTKLTALAALAVAAVTLTSVAAAGPDAAKQRVAITMNDLEHGTFVLTPLQAGTLKRDSGTASRVSKGSGVVTRGNYTLEGQRGSLTIRERIEWFIAGSGYNVATGTWKVVSGTGEYAEVAGGGRIAHVARDRPPPLWTARQEGFLTAP
jgi:hypothetical protein